MNSFRHLPDDIIEINGEQFDLELFLEVEPDYFLPEGMISRFYDGSRHILYSDNNQSLGESPWNDGDRYLTRAGDLNLLLKTIQEDVKYIENLKKAEPPKSTKEGEYPPIKDLIVAMWEHFVEGRPKEETINIVQEKRLKVKEKYSNENNL
tara:strand:- start:1846 stop:2298 length:453 start_codon:yes stop_codon:yes gene_type:complete